MLVISTLIYLNMMHCGVFDISPHVYDDSFIVLNTNHGNNPITLFDHENRDSTLPLRLSILTHESFPFQLFKVRYNYDRNFWLAPRIDLDYGSVNNSTYLIARKGTFEPNLKLQRVKEFSQTKIYKIVSGAKCLTVGKNIINDHDNYWKLEFKDCQLNNKDQEFMFIPQVVALSYLERTSEIDLKKRDIEKAYGTLNKVLKNIVQRETEV